jgi:hypothetical protein
MRGNCNRNIAAALAVITWVCVSTAPAEVILQYFNTSYQELALKLPELAEAGYEAIWLPPPTKASGGLSTGYDCWDPFDLGSKDQSGSVQTKYGTDGELRSLIAAAHRFGIRVYVDNIMNHRAFSVPGYDAGSPIDTYPGMVPEDFHLRTTEEGFYRKWDNVADWSDTWQVQNRNFSDLIDIAQEVPDNGNFGQTEGDHVPKIKLVRHPNNPEYYCYMPGAGDGVYVGFDSTNITWDVLNDSANAWFYEEDVNAYLIRAVRWLVHHTRIDGLRLDAVKHVPAYFFGEQWAGDKAGNGNGYCGQAQVQFNLTRVFDDWNDHRDTVFDPEASFGRNDLMMFGEHLGSPPPVGDYIASGMRLVDSELHGFLNGNLGQSWGTVAGLQSEGGEGFAWDHGVTYVKSHDDDYSTRPELQFALTLTRRGLPCVYTDGNYQSETLGESGGAFPRHANINFLGQWGDDRIPNLVYIHNHFARSWQWGRWGDQDVVAYDRIDKRENGGMSDGDGTVLFFVMNDDYANGQYREISTSFPAGSWLWQYSTAGGGFYYQVSWDQKIKVITPPGGYFAFSWRSPEDSDLWSGAGGNSITIQENGSDAGWISYEREDGPDGDPGFNPYGVVDEDPTDFAYTYYVPRITNPTNVRFAVRTDGSAKNVLLKLDGGVDINGNGRDHLPGNSGSTAVFEGYEQIGFVQRQYREKFAAADIARNTVGSLGAETYVATIGSVGWTINNGTEAEVGDDNTANWIQHAPGATNEAGAHFWPEPENAADAPVYLAVKVGYSQQINKMFVYYTTDGASWPEGAGGETVGAAHVTEMNWATNGTPDGGGTPDWWKCALPAMTNGTVLRYKIGAFLQQNGDTNASPHVPYAIPFPNDDYSIYNKKSMMGLWEQKDLDLSALTYYPHNDYDTSTLSTGLVEGFHVVRARAFLERDNKASIYNTFTQPFYYDVQTPEGRIVWPPPGEVLPYQHNRYGCVVHADQTANAVYYHIEDSNPENDDGQTGQTYGNGTNALGEFAWVAATKVRAGTDLAMTTTNAWRFDYENIPTNSQATIYVKLGELSSSTNPALSAVEGHFTVLTNTVTANGPDFTMFVAFPQHDGNTIGLPYDMKVRCSKALWDGFDQESQLRPRFLIKLDGVAKDRNAYEFPSWPWPVIDGKYYDLEFDLPNLWDGDPERLHEIEVTHTDAGGGDITLVAKRLYKAAEAEDGPYVDIVTPPEFDSDGKPYEIILPDVASPQPEDRQFTIRVETDLQALHCWIEFTNSVGVAVPYASTTNALTSTVALTAGTNLVAGEKMALSGTVSVSTSNTTITGIGTTFESELSVGNRILIGSNIVTVSNIASNTSLTISDPYLGGNQTNEAAWLQSAFDSELNIGSRVSIDGNILNVETIGSSSNFTTTVAYPGATTNGVIVYRIDGNPTVSGNRQNWNFLWTDMTAGEFTFRAFVNTAAPDTSERSAYAIRNARVILREQVPADENDNDDDDDGLSDSNEGTPVDLPETNAETWENGDVHAWRIFGRTDPTLPDTDGDLLPDGLESGWRVADTNMTDVTVDTNGDGYPNFIADLDPPFYNTVPDNNGLPEYVFNDSRTRMIHGSMTDPQKPDSDYDGIVDGIEDWNRNGWVDGDGNALQPTTGNPWDDRTNEGEWPDGEVNAWETWSETDPNNGDTDGDGASDGYGEDMDGDGWICGDLNSNRVHEVGELWLETDPLNPDTDGDGLPDGWERQYSFDPFDDGLNGHTNLSTGVANTNDTEHGAAGNPDGDVIVEGGVTNEYTNIMEFGNGTNPRIPNSLEPPPEGSIVIGPGDPIGGGIGVTNYQEFTDWTWDDCVVLDEYEGDGGNNQQGDLYLGWDGWDTSRDIVAFYAHDGGDVSNGDGMFYFRVDFHDLRALAEEESLDLYVVIDTGNPAQGEMNLPDDIDTITWNRWEAVVAVYKSSQGAVYVDTQRIAENNTTSWGQDLYSHGVERRDQNAANGFVDAYFNAELDAVEFAISRQALRDAGWSGTGASNFNYQVYTTKDGTQNDGSGGGDIGGRSDIRDAIYNDGIAEDYWQSQAGLEPILKYWIPGTSKAGRAKASVVLHGNQAIRPGSAVQNLVNTGQGAGYYRALDVHETFEQGLNLHITPTLASALEWAAVDPGAGKPWRDGPLLNQQIATLVDTNIVDLLGSTFSDHMLPYFSTAYNQDNESLARDYLGRIYGFAPSASRTVFWTPERLLDHNVFGKIKDMGYYFTVLDQNTHMFNWFGRTESLIEAGYRLNEIYGVKCFVINDIATSYLFSNTDGGVDTSLRSLFSRKARSGVQDQVVTMAVNWETFADNDSCDGYDANIRWIANRPWVELVTLEQIAAGEVDVTGDDVGDYWYAYPRGEPSQVQQKEAHNWLNHASQGDYDHWYGGSSIEESLETRRFEIRPGTNVVKNYGMMFYDSLVSDAWGAVNAITDANLSALARAALHASTFQTAFHNEDNNDLRRYSTGAYMYPATSFNTLAPFALHSQAQTRMAAQYGRVDQWASVASGIATTQTASEDVDLDGEDEYLLYNRHLFALFERLGGHVVGVWLRDSWSGDVFQVMGNVVGYSGSATELEGTSNVDTNGAVVAYRTAGLKDWWVDSSQYINDLYAASGVAKGWQFASSDGDLQKTITLADDARELHVQYALSGALSGKTLYVRSGLSPNLADLLVNGQKTLGPVVSEGGVTTLSNTNYGKTVSASVVSPNVNLSAVDDWPDGPAGPIEFDTVNMRNQAQTHQLELSGQGSFDFALQFAVTESDWDGDGMPNLYEDGFGFLSSSNAADGDLDQDGDNASNRDEYISGTGPAISSDYLHASQVAATNTGIVVRFPARTRREYRIYYDNVLTNAAGWSSATPTPITVGVDGIYEWVDDGSTTEPDPFDATNRFYRIDVQLAE